MGCSHLQFEVLRVLVNLLISYFANQHQGRLFRVAGELTFSLDPADETRKVVPDLYIMEDEPQGGPKLPSWKFWEHEGKVPSFALEVVSDAYTKDYMPDEICGRYQQLGVPELIRYDPDFSTTRPRTAERRLLTHWVRNEAGILVEQPVEGAYVRLRKYALWLLHRPPYYLRIATGDAVDRLELYPTDAERAQQSIKLAQTEAERARTEAERADDAERELRRLRAELARLRSNAGMND